MSAAKNNVQEPDTAAAKLGKAALAATLAASIGVPTANSMQHAELPDVVPLTLVIDNNPPAPDLPPAAADEDHSDKARKASLQLIAKIAALVVAAVVALFGVVQCAGTYLNQTAVPAPFAAPVSVADASSSSAAAFAPADTSSSAAAPAVSPEAVPTSDAAAVPDAPSAAAPAAGK